MSWWAISRCRSVSGAVAILFLTAGCSDNPTEPHDGTGRPLTPPSSHALVSYFPPSERMGGWRKTTDRQALAGMGISATKLSELGEYTMSLPWENYRIGVRGYHPSNKASLVIKNGWIVGEWYNQASARNAMYYLASNGKTFAMMLLGRLVLDHPELGIGLSTPLYDPRWLPQGFPLTDPRKSTITFGHLLQHVSGVIPQVQDPVANTSVLTDPRWNFEPFTLGKDADFPVTAQLYYSPGDPSAYAKVDTYSSVGFNHLSLVFRNVTGLEASVYLRRKMLNPIGVGAMSYRLSPGMGSYVWATGGNNFAGARDYARLAYLLLHEGNWAGRRIFTAAWIRQFTTVAGYPNISSNAQCGWGTAYPKDTYRIIGSGINLAFVIPSLDLVATLNGRTPNALRDQVTAEFLRRLFASITQQYVTCDGQVMNGGSATAP